jgi:phage tail sheath gpL-like
MTITFNNIPANTRVPDVYIEVDNSRALKGLFPWYQRVLLVGQKVSAGSATAGQLVFVPSAEAAQTLFGAGSMLERMFQIFKANNPLMEAWALPLDDAGAAVAASCRVTIAGTATSAGTIHFMIDGTYVPIPVASGDGESEIRATVKEYVNDTSGAKYGKLLPVIYDAEAAGYFELDCKNAGALGKMLDIRWNYAQGQELPPGITLTLTTPFSGSSGATDPTLDTALAVLDDEQFDYIVYPYTDDTNLGYLKTVLDERFGPLVQMPSIVFGSVKDTYANLVLWNDHNHHDLSMMGYYNAPHAPWLWASGIGGMASYHLNNDPARPLQRLKLSSLLPPTVESGSRFIRSEREILLNKGIATFIVDDGGNIQLERMITTYLTNEAGVPDISYLDVNTLATLMYVRYQFRARMLTRFPRHKLADDDAQVGRGQYVARRKDIEMETIALAGDLAEAGIIENLAEFKTNLIVERDSTDPNRINVLLPANNVNQFRVLAVKYQFIL